MTSVDKSRSESEQPESDRSLIDELAKLSVGERLRLNDASVAVVTKLRAAFKYKADRRR